MHLKEKREAIIFSLILHQANQYAKFIMMCEPNNRAIFVYLFPKRFIFNTDIIIPQNNLTYI